MASTYMGGASVQPAPLPGLENVTTNNQTTTSTHDTQAPVNPSSDTTPTNYSQDHMASKDETPARSTTEDEEDSELERRHSIVRDLARQYTNQSQMSAISGNPFTADENSPLNPRSDKFRALAWAKAISKLHSETGFTNRKAGVCYQNLNVFGYGQPTDYQKNVANIWLDAASLPRQLMGYGKTRIDIIRDFDGVVKNGEMLVVLGPPGSGCSTYLKTISGETSGIYINDDAYFNYRGITAHEMHTRHRGEAIYTAEVDVHFPHLTVGDTLDFAAHARAPRSIPGGIDRETFISHSRDVVMAMFGISHTVNTKVGNEYVRGVSGGERKRVTIAEASLSGAPLQCWDNSTRGLDSANAVEFCKTLRLQTQMSDTAALVSIYQAPQAAYDIFDKVVVLYEGRQIFFGGTKMAKQYFVDLGFECPARQTVPDFLTSMTSPQERIIRKGFEDRAPRTPDEFAAAWKASQANALLQREIEEYKRDFPINGPEAEEFRANRRAAQAKNQRKKSPYTLSYWQQTKLCVWRGFKRLVTDPTITLTQLFGNFIMALIVGSVFYNIDQTTASFFQRGALLFLACLSNAFSSALEILTLYAQRPIVEKHDRYALYHPSSEAVASMLCDMPYKILNAFTYNLTLYFMTNLRREPGPFFFFLFITFLVTLCMSMIFRTIASASRTLSQAMVPAALLILALVTFTGFVIQIDYMLGWCRWINYVNPLAYAFESLMVNEFHNRKFECNLFIPTYPDAAPENRVCSTVGAVQGEPMVSGDRYINLSFSYYHAHKWRNVGIVIAFTLLFLATYMFFAETVSAKKSKGEVLVFRRGHRLAKNRVDAESSPAGRVAITEKEGYGEGQPSNFKSTSVFHWNNVCYDIKIKSENRRILDNVAGWVKPGTMTALMGVSGAGKTTLLDCLADRTSMGVIHGDILVDDKLRDASFQRKTGYVQQQDLHLSTTTVREALNFSAIMRQPKHIPVKQKIAYVDEVIKMLDMQDYSEAVVGVLGEGLNVEQRKRLTIGVELAAKPPVLLFVDEPTSGLDSQTSWAILDLLEKLARSGQAILCTIHQPSAMLFQRFDRLLFLASGGKTVYFGDVGDHSRTMTQYFEAHGAEPCPPEANPAEWMLEVIGAAPGSETNLDWPQIWKDSSEFVAVQQHLQELSHHRVEKSQDEDPHLYDEFAATFTTQLKYVTTRVFEQYWRTPSYIYSKAALCTLVALFIGFSFYQAPNTALGLQNQMFAIFQVLTVFGQLTQQQMPHFVIQRDLYEVRERPSKTYSWQVFILSQIIVEIPWNTLMAAIMYFCWYYPIGLYRNAEPTDAVAERGALMFLLFLVFMLFTCTFTDFIIAGCSSAETGGNIANLLFMMCLIFCGVLAPPNSFPKFWIWMYRVSPFTYLISAILSTAVANTEAVCAQNEYVVFPPPEGQTCGEYMQAYIKSAGGYLVDKSSNSTCTYCTIGDSNVFLARVQSHYDERWRNFGLMWVYIIFNVFAALALYWLVRVPKNKKGKKEKKE
ncbi:ATPase [Fusarium oxysporum f. sp. radicis-lycopersici 26381]|nr:ATPase [Fusarium oxysporum f. sp. lycopersici MN25]EWZ81309.1 ATPase [Fusarium oxysporum f. sp. lycopersici MN25]EXL58072.1 ATPase [Fusarium oxysporum f. sp. radicis-lycopersici 26381]EXL58073.1 ATPase [Fusarium oxysporum f. sp. radicis-lycopersici 26381]